MTTIELRLPQLGEGLREARIVRLLKTPGDAVARDECLYTVETDKAEMEVESPVDGVLEDWRVQEDQFVEVGGVVATLSSDAAAPDEEEPEAPAAERDDGRAAAQAPTEKPGALSTRVLPPRTRAYARQKGLGNDDLRAIAKTTDKIAPKDIDAFLAARRLEVTEEEGAIVFPMPDAQRLVAQRLAQSYQQVIPASIEVLVPWAPVRAARDAAARTEGLQDLRPSAFMVASWCVAQAAKDHPKFRSTLLDHHRVRQSEHVNLGIAVARPDDELVSAVIPKAGALNLEEFLAAARHAIDTARDQGDQAMGQTIHIALSNMGSFDIRSGVPIVMAPAVATIVFATPFTTPTGKDAAPGEVANMVVGFDHRWINGVAAAHFAKSIRDRIERLAE
jgi:pyruvate/2-oxoglutarate dehydrogenase complex dihydrolipoamide acyltransferase (E2) component